MVGVPFNPDNCIFISNQALNANQFGAVPNASNQSNHTILWDTVESKLYWVNTLTNIIEKEFPSGSGSGNELSSNYTGANSTYTMTLSPAVYGNNYILLPAGTYNFELEYDFREGADGYSNAFLQAEIRTNTNQSITTANGSDVVQSYRNDRNGGIIKAGSPGAIIVQNVCKNNVTFANPFIVKSAFYTVNETETTNEIGRLFLRALKVK